MQVNKATFKKLDNGIDDQLMLYFASGCDVRGIACLLCEVESETSIACASFISLH
jgi:hypothetical protein